VPAGYPRVRSVTEGAHAAAPFGGALQAEPRVESNWL